MSKYSITGLPWSHGLGTDVTQCKTSRECMETAGLNFFVDKCELVAKMPFSVNGNNKLDDSSFAYGGNLYRDCPNAYATYRTDFNVPLGLVKSKYEVIQNIDAFNFFDTAIGLNQAEWVSAGKFGLGHKVFICAKLPIKTNVHGDEIDNYLVLSNSHDGSESITVMFTPVRVFCTNCLNGALEKAHSYIRIKHTKSAPDRLQEGAEVLRIACQYAKNAEDLYNSLYAIKVSDDMVMKYIANLFMTDAEIQALQTFDSQNGYKRLYNRDYMTMQSINISTRKINQIVNAFEYYLDGIGQKQIAGTAWGAYNAITGFYSNVANLEGERRMDSLLYGSSGNNMLKALNMAHDLAEAA